MSLHELAAMRAEAELTVAKETIDRMRRRDHDSLVDTDLESVGRLVCRAREQLIEAREQVERLEQLRRQTEVRS